MASADFKCIRCLCKKNCNTCVTCIFMHYKCRGTCLCCAEYRKKVSNQDSSKKEHSVYCPQCQCESDTSTCEDCSTGNILCGGTCLCCKAPQEKSSDSPIALPLNENLDEAVPPTATEEINTRNSNLPVPSASIDAPESPQTDNSESTASATESVPEETNGYSGNVCTQCHCRDGNIPCDLCINPQFRCGGTCDCCQSASNDQELSTLDTDNKEKLKAMCCPRCLCKLGEGSCDQCIKQSEVGSTGAIPKKKKTPQPNSYEQYGNTNGNYIPAFWHPSALFLNPMGNMKRAAFAYMRSKRENTVTANSSVNLENYCMHCECVRGREPCDLCKRLNFECYGRCLCCKDFNKSLLKLGEYFPEELVNSTQLTELKETTNVSVGVETEDSIESTSEVRNGFTYSEILECANCRCISLHRTCDICINSKEICKIKKGEQWCTCCIVKFLSSNAKGYKKRFQ